MKTQTLFTHTEPDPFGVALHTRFTRFKSKAGIDGLMRDNGKGQIELLAVHTFNPGRGQFRQFIKQLKQVYAVICVWHIGERWLMETLARYEFDPETMVDEFGDTLEGMRWDAHPKKSGGLTAA